MRKQLLIFVNIIIFSLSSYSSHGLNNNSNNLIEDLCFTNVDADFTWTQDTSAILKINFSDNSTGAIISWDWDFGDNSYAIGQYATHSYAYPGYYTVCLTVEDTNGIIDVFCDSVYVSYTMQCSANFTYQKQGLTVLFNGNGNPAPYEYLWNFGDGISFYSQSLLHTYQTPGTYNVCLRTKNIDPVLLDTCVNLYCKSITVSSQVATLFGHVYVDTVDGDYADEAEILLINVDSSNFFTIVDTAFLVDSGSYTYFYFQNIPFGRYALKAQPLKTSNFYSNYVPTYYGNKIHWNSAEIINISNINNTAFIDLKKMSTLNGIGSISGKIAEGSAKLPGDPISNIEILLLNLNYDPVAITYSDENGKYHFNNLPFDDYIVYAEVISKTTYPATVLLNSNNPVIQNVNLYVNSTSVTTGLEGSNIKSWENNVSEIFPNPTSYNISFEIKSKLQEEIEISIYNNLGQIIYLQPEKLSLEKTTFSINTSSYAQGVYFVFIRQENKVIVARKFVKLP